MQTYGKTQQEADDEWNRRADAAPQPDAPDRRELEAMKKSEDSRDYEGIREYNAALGWNGAIDAILDRIGGG